jgi:stage II sporulation protein D
MAGRSFPAGSVLVLIDPTDKGPWTFEVRRGSKDPTVIATFSDDDANLTVRSLPPSDPEVDPVGDIQVPIRVPDAHRYRGRIRIGRWHGRLRIVNRAPIEAFVRSVVPREMGPSNHLEALKAQAVATRSYWLAGRNGSNDWFDVRAHRASHSYTGIEGEDDRVNEAVDATARQVLRYEGVIARTFYFAVGGGATEASANVFTDAKGRPGTWTPYLRGGADLDPDGVPFDIDAEDYAWRTAAFTIRDLSRILSRDPRTDVGRLTRWPVSTKARFLAMRTAEADQPANRGVSGRLTWIVLEGTEGTKRVAGWLFKSVYNTHRLGGGELKSTLFFRARVPEGG